MPFNEQQILTCPFACALLFIAQDRLFLNEQTALPLRRTEGQNRASALSTVALTPHLQPAAPRSTLSSIPICGGREDE